MVVVEVHLPSCMIVNVGRGLACWWGGGATAQARFDSEAAQCGVVGGEGGWDKALVGQSIFTLVRQDDHDVMRGLLASGTKAGAGSLRQGQSVGLRLVRPVRGLHTGKAPSVLGGAGEPPPPPPPPQPTEGVVEDNEGLTVEV